MKSSNKRQISNINSFIELQIQAAIAHSHNGHHEYAINLFRTITDITAEEVEINNLKNQLKSSLARLSDPIKHQCETYLFSRIEFEKQ